MINIKISLKIKKPPSVGFPPFAFTLSAKGPMLGGGNLRSRTLGIFL